MYLRKPQAYLITIEAKLPKSLAQRVSEFFGTALGTYFGLLLFLFLYALAGTTDYNAARIEKQAIQATQR